MSSSIAAFTNSSLPPDVEVVIDNVYRLHSAILRINSPYFERILSDVVESPADQNGIKYRFRLVVNEDGGLCNELKLVSRDAEENVSTQQPEKVWHGILIAIQQNEGGREFTPQMSMDDCEWDDDEEDNSGNYGAEQDDKMADFSDSDSSSSRRSMTSGIEVSEDVVALEILAKLEKPHEILFGIFYRDPHRPTPTFEEIQEIVRLASLYECMPIVSPTIENILVSQMFHRDVWCRKEEALIHLAVKIRSKTIYHDAVILFVGRCLNHPSLLGVERLNLVTLRAVTRELIAVASIRSQTDRRLAVYFAESLQHGSCTARLDDVLPILRGEHAAITVYKNLRSTDPHDRYIKWLQAKINKLLANNLILKIDGSDTRLRCANVRELDYPWLNGYGGEFDGWTFSIIP